jgi:fatty acid desaturase (delta-4 desaturase)
MSTNTLVNKALGLTDDLIGGSSLMWRYHHQVTSTSSYGGHMSEAA